MAPCPAAPPTLSCLALPWLCVCRYPWRLEPVDVTRDTLYSGTLGTFKDRMWAMPGDKYAVTVKMTTPFLDYETTQVRACMPAYVCLCVWAWVGGRGAAAAAQLPAAY